MTIEQWVKAAREKLEMAGKEDAKLEAELLAAHVCGQSRSWVLVHSAKEFSSDAADVLLVRRLSNEPLAYILGKREFYSRDFVVSPGVLIPRQETEVLVSTALRWLNNCNITSPRVLDIGTGSGAIAVTIKLECPHAIITASEISEAALTIAQQNATSYAADIHWLPGDFFAQQHLGKFDLIVSNPPYIDPSEKINEEVRDFEPNIALFAAEGGTEFYRLLADDLPTRLEPHGRVLLEIGYRQEETVSMIFESRGWRRIETIRDLLGHPRVLAFEKCEI